MMMMRWSIHDWRNHVAPLFVGQVPSGSRLGIHRHKSTTDKHAAFAINNSILPLSLRSLYLVAHLRMKLLDGNERSTPPQIQSPDWEAPELNLLEISFVNLLRKSRNGRIFHVRWQDKDCVLKVVSSISFNQHNISNYFSITTQT